MAKNSTYDVLDKLAIPYKKLLDSTGEQISGTMTCKALGASPDRVYKSVLFVPNRGPLHYAVILVLPADREVSLAKVESATGRKGRLAGNDETEKVTGHGKGLFGPIGNGSVPVLLDVSASKWEKVIVNAGGRGEYIELSPDDLLAATNGAYADLSDSYSVEMFGRNEELPEGALIGGYQVIELRHKGTLEIVYTARRLSDGKKVFLCEWFPRDRCGHHAVRRVDGLRVTLMRFVHDMQRSYRFDPDEEKHRSRFENLISERYQEQGEDAADYALPITDYLYANDTVYAVSDFEEGELLGERVRAGRLLDWGSVKSMLCPLLPYIRNFRESGRNLGMVRPNAIFLGEDSGKARLLLFCPPSDLFGRGGTLQYLYDPSLDPYIDRQVGADDLRAFTSVVCYAMTGKEQYRLTSEDARSLLGGIGVPENELESVLSWEILSGDSLA